MNTGRRTRQGRPAIAGWLAALLVLVLVAAVALNWTAISGWFSPASAGPGNTLLPASADEVAQARTLLGRLAVVPRPGFARGYARSSFGEAWADTDGNGCNQRDDVLLRDLVAAQPHRVQRQRDCDHDVLSGTWLDPYTGTTITLTDAKREAESVQIDHIVALSVAWRYGASAWPAERRLTFANDLRNLVAVGGAANKEKGGSDAAEWRPVRGAQCGYAVRYVTMKAAYALPTDLTERSALTALLDTCG
jgi:hypothetical protein